MQPVVMSCSNRMSNLRAPSVMGILNVTPDSFSDGGRFVSPSAAIAQAERMVAEGATLIDGGGESTRPGAAPVSVAQELDRVIPVIERISRELNVLISVDTSTPQVMIEAARAGAYLINDVRALQRQGALQAAAESGLSVCLMHMQGEPETMQKAPSYTEVVADVIRFLRSRIDACVAAGIAHSRLLVDPGIGFGKTVNHNLALLNRLDELAVLDAPLLVGVSRKSLIGAVLDRPVDQRLFGGLALAVIAVQKGASIIRTHDIAATVDAVRMTHAVMQESQTQETYSP